MAIGRRRTNAMSRDVYVEFECWNVKVGEDGKINNFRKIRE